MDDRMNCDIGNNNYGEDIPYSKVCESSDSAYKRDIWDTAIGLQKVDGLEVSDYLKACAEENIAGNKSYGQIEDEIIRKYGDELTPQKEADLVSVRISRLLETGGFTFSPATLLSIHRQLFDGVGSIDPVEAGGFRKYNIYKNEKILFGESVTYGDYHDIPTTLGFYFEEEEKADYSGKWTDEDIEHLSTFTKRIWQVHPFAEGNTRTVAVFIEMYLRTMGYEVNNEPFKSNSLFYRNALVRSCYSKPSMKAKPTNSFLNHFNKNLLCGTSYVLDSFDTFITNTEDINYMKDGDKQDS